MNRILQALVCLFFSFSLFSQVSVVENFDAGTPAGWTDTYLNTSSQTCTGNSERDNLYSGEPTGDMTSPNQVGASNGTDITFSIDYKVVDWSAATNPTADGWGSADLQYSTDDGANWMTAGTIDDSNDSNSNVCMTFTVTIPGASVPNGSDVRFRVLNTWLAGDYYFYIDDFSATQIAVDPPNCDVALTSPTTDFPLDGTLVWSPASGIPTGYKLSIGTSSGGMDILPETDLGATTNYDASGLGLNYGTVYHALIVPYNANGDAMGCTSESFMTEADPNMTFTVTCGSSTNTTHCYDSFDATTFLYTASDGVSALKMVFNAGGIESCCDDILIYDGTDNTATLLYSGNEGGDLTGLEVTASGPNIFMEIDSDVSISCQSGSGCCTTEWDWDVTCLSCSPAAGTATIGTCNDVLGYSINVDVTSIGDGTVIIANDGGVGSTTVMATGIYSVGPFGFSSTVTITLEHPTDPSCNVVLAPVTLGAVCPPDEDVCTGAITIPVSSNTCAGLTTGNNTGATDSNNDMPQPPAATCTSYAGGDIWFKLTVPASGNVTISGASSDCCSFLWYEIYTGADCSGLSSLQCSSTSGNDPSTFETDLTGQTPGSMIWIRAWDSSNDNGPGDFNFCAYELTCIAPTVTIPVDPIDNANCPTTVDVSISIDNLGDSGTLTISAEDDLGNPAGTGGMTSSTGIFTITNVPVPQTSWTIKIAHETDAFCDVELGPFLLNCPPLNDAICDAEALTVGDPPTTGNNAYSTIESGETGPSCWFTGSSNTVWYSFMAPATGKVEITTDFVTPLNDTQLGLYELTDCADFSTATDLGCGEDDGVTGSGFMAIINTESAPLTAGQMYYVQVDGYSTGVGEFQIQINELPPSNDDCATAAVLAENTTGSLINQFFGGATASGMGPEICDVTAFPAPKDVWYSINTDADGGDLIVVVEPGPQSDVVVAIYDACGALIPEQCVDLGGNGGIETINFNANLHDKKGDVSTTRDADYFVRVYEKIPSGQPFEIGAQGAALPIVLGNFDAKAEKRGNNVTWTTLSEINSKYIEVQSSPNGSTKWEVVGTVDARGQSSSEVNYELFDSNPYEVTYYRLNAVDKDGTQEFSRIINVRRNDVLGKMIVFPNPAFKTITVQTASNRAELAIYSVINATGKVVMSGSANLIKGLNSIQLNLDDLTPGIYMFRLLTEDGLQVKKFVKE